jgi:glycosyltransferase involved in cell wall biosynthesis
MTQLRIVHLITALNVGGAEMMLYKLLSRMDRRRFASSVVSLMDTGPIGKRIEELGVPVYELGMRRGRAALRSVATLLTLLASERPYILQTWMYHADLLGLITGQLSRVPHVVWNIRRSTGVVGASPRRTLWTAKACSRLSSWPSVVVTNTEAGRVFHNGLGYHPRRWAVIPNGFDLDRFAPSPCARESVRAELGLAPDALLIGLVGRFDPMKDHTTFLRAAMHLEPHRQGIHFVLVGRDVVPSNTELTAMITGQEIEKRVHLLGERTDVPRLMAALDILCSSSCGEGFANVIGEAMACGVPCVVTDVGDSADIVGETGLVVPPRDARRLSDAWVRLIEAGEEKRQVLGQAARERVRQNYSLDGIVRVYEQLYLSLKES